ncbi:hypothetical protein Tco_0433239 [Tanacetum coccineum]
MASLDYHLNPLFTIKECSSCGSLYNKGYCCTSDSFQQPPQDCMKCGNPVEGPNCQGCALWRKKLKEVWFTICHENGIYQDFLNTYESSNDNTNIVNAPQEPFVSCGKGAHYGYNCPQEVPVISNTELFQNQTIKELPQTLLSGHPTCNSGDEDSFTYDSNHNFVDDSPNPSSQPPTYTYEFYRNNAYYSHDCPPQVPFTYNPEQCYN